MDRLVVTFLGVLLIAGLIGAYLDYDKNKKEVYPSSITMITTSPEKTSLKPGIALISLYYGHS